MGFIHQLTCIRGGNNLFKGTLRRSMEKLWSLDFTHYGGRNPTAVDRWLIPWFLGFQPSKLMQDFFYPQYDLQDLARKRHHIDIYIKITVQYIDNYVDWYIVCNGYGHLTENPDQFMINHSSIMFHPYRSYCSYASYAPRNLPDDQKPPGPAKSWHPSDWRRALRRNQPRLPPLTSPRSLLSIPLSEKSLSCKMLMIFGSFNGRIKFSFSKRIRWRGFKSLEVITRIKSDDVQLQLSSTQYKC